MLSAEFGTELSFNNYSLILNRQTPPPSVNKQQYCRYAGAEHSEIFDVRFPPHRRRLRPTPRPDAYSGAVRTARHPRDPRCDPGTANGRDGRLPRRSPVVHRFPARRRPQEQRLEVALPNRSPVGIVYHIKDLSEADVVEIESVIRWSTHHAPMPRPWSQFVGAA